MVTAAVVSSRLIALAVPGQSAELQWKSPDDYRVLLTVDGRGMPRSNSPAQVAAYKFTHRSIYLEQARRFAHMAVDFYFQDSPLP